MPFKKTQETLITNTMLHDEFVHMLQDNVLPYQTLISQYRCALMEIQTRFNVLNEQFSLEYDRNPIEAIKARLKSTEGIMGKLKRRGYEKSLESIETNLMDIAGIRVVCSFTEDIYRLAECLLNQDDIILLEKKDYIANPKPNGYRSLHLIVAVPIFLQNEKKHMKVEVQFRTIAMDFWASIEHKLKYKKGFSEEDTADVVAELATCAEISADLDRRMEQIRNHIGEIVRDNDDI